MEIRPVMKVVGIQVNLEVPEAANISSELTLLVERGMTADEFPALNGLERALSIPELQESINNER